MNKSENEIVESIDADDAEETYTIRVRFTKRKTEGGYSYLAEFPDVETCIAKGGEMTDTWKRAVDIISYWLLNACMEDREKVRLKSMDCLFNSQGSDENVVNSFIRVNLAEYKRKLSKRSIKKSVTIPEWLNEYAERKSVNFSQILQSALIEHLSKN